MNPNLCIQSSFTKIRQKTHQDYCIQCYATHLGWKLSWSWHEHERQGDDGWWCLMHFDGSCEPSLLSSNWNPFCMCQSQKWKTGENKSNICIIRATFSKEFCCIFLGPWLWPPWQFALGLGMWVVSHVCSWPTLWWKASVQQRAFFCWFWGHWPRGDTIWNDDEIMKNSVSSIHMNMHAFICAWGFSICKQQSYEWLASLRVEAKFPNRQGACAVGSWRMGAWGGMLLGALLSGWLTMTIQYWSWMTCYSWEFELLPQNSSFETTTLIVDSWYFDSRSLGIGNGRMRVRQQFWDH